MQRLLQEPGDWQSIGQLSVFAVAGLEKTPFVARCRWGDKGADAGPDLALISHISLDMGPTWGYRPGKFQPLLRDKRQY
jgi:hypothetical protein